MSTKAWKVREILGFLCNSYIKMDPEAVSDLGGGLIWVGGGFNLGRELARAQKTQKWTGGGFMLPRWVDLESSFGDLLGTPFPASLFWEPHSGPSFVFCVFRVLFFWFLRFCLNAICKMLNEVLNL